MEQTSVRRKFERSFGVETRKIHVVSFIFGGSFFCFPIFQQASFLLQGNLPVSAVQKLLSSFCVNSVLLLHILFFEELETPKIARDVK